jgi:exopolysaccharide biosynthesis protein
VLDDEPVERDGRDTGYSAGVTMTELAEIMQGLGATTAYNLDGGGSATMVFGGDVVNSPSEGNERGVSDILYIGY